MKLIKLLFSSTFMLFAAMVLASLASPVAANGVVEICHVPPKHNQTEPFATGRQIEIPKEDCEDHCIDHGGDGVAADANCAATIFIRNQCIVNSPEPGCSIERCTSFCTAECGYCLTVHDATGCEPDSCESAICAIDPFCCEVTWDNICATEAFEICVPGNLCED
jgi:hypothetical protein